MPLLSPPRFQAPFKPVRRESLPVQLFTSMERAIKGALFGCRMCGNCILQETAFICPMTCCPITNPLVTKVRTAVLAADLALGRDEYSMAWIKAYRQRQKK